MKKILFVLIALGANVVMAQGLYPELAGIDGRGKKADQVVGKKAEPAKVVVENTVIEKPAATNTEENMPKISAESDIDLENAIGAEPDEYMEDEEEVEIEPQEDLFAQKAEPEQTEPEATDAAEEAESDDDEEDDEQKIIIYMADVDITTPPNYNFAYCFGTLRYQNKLKRPIRALDFELTYGAYSTPFSIKNLKKGAEGQSEEFSLVGESCNTLTGMPEMKITRCLVEGMDEKKCKKKVVFVPMKE